MTDLTFCHQGKQRNSGACAERYCAAFRKGIAHRAMLCAVERKAGITSSLQSQMPSNYH